MAMCVKPHIKVGVLFELPRLMQSRRFVVALPIQIPYCPADCQLGH